MTPEESHQSSAHKQPQPRSGSVKSSFGSSLPATDGALRQKILRIEENNTLSPGAKFQKLSQLMGELLCRGAPIGPSVLATLAHRAAKTYKYAPRYEQQSLARAYLSPPDSFLRTLVSLSVGGISNHNAQEVSNNRVGVCDARNERRRAI
jgi:hypothetical protein